VLASLLLGFLAELLAGWLGSRVVCKLVGYGSAASATRIITRLFSWLAGLLWLAGRLWFGYGSAMVLLVRLASWFGWLAGWLWLAMVPLVVALFIIKRLVCWWVVCSAVCLA
jgi:hypothetical protein